LERSTILYTIVLDIKYAFCNHSLASQLLDKQETPTVLFPIVVRDFGLFDRSDPVLVTISVLANSNDTGIA
jgi:hypothetical protein